MMQVQDSRETDSRSSTNECVDENNQGAADGMYWMPILPRDIAERLDDKASWPDDLTARYSELRKTFSASKAEFASWLRKDRNSQMNSTAKSIALVILDCLNFHTGRCDPSHQYIADELGLSVRTVERTIPRIVAAGWLSVKRRGRTTSNFYKLGVSLEKVAAILDYSDSLRDQRSDERKRRRECDPTKLADHRQSDPPFVRTHEPTKVADHDPTKLAGKQLKRTYEDEPLNTFRGSELREDTHTREAAIGEQEDPFDPASTIEAGRAFLVATGLPPRFIEAAMHRLMRGKLYPRDVIEWKRQAMNEAIEW